MQHILAATCVGFILRCGPACNPCVLTHLKLSMPSFSVNKSRMYCTSKLATEM